MAIALSTGALAACNSSGPAGAGSGPVRVVAAENFWGSLARQLGGSHASVRSIIVNPDTDPHSYEPTAADARALAGAQLAIVNGVGYDSWASRLLEGEPTGGRIVLDVGRLLGLATGANPHRWYFPEDVQRVIAAITGAYERLDPSAAGYFAARRRQLESVGLARYHALLAQIASRYHGVPVGYSESIFQGLGEALHLRLLTPYSFVKAIAEGSEVSAADRLTVDRQAERGQIEVWVFNSQNVTPDVQRVNEIARARGIPITTITETLSPPSASFQQWQVAQLEALATALAEAAHR